MTGITYISALPVAASVGLTDIVPITQGSTGANTGTTRQATIGQVLTGGLGVYNVETYGAVGDGTTDDSPALVLAMAAAVAAGGGTILFPRAVTYRLASAIQPPYTGNPYPQQKPLRITGVGAAFNSYLIDWSAVTGGTVLDLRYDGSSTSVAKIDTRGGGSLEIDNLTLACSAGLTTPFVWTTNTRLYLHDLRIIGNTALSGVGCVQQAIQLGGATAASTTLYGILSTNGFQGYGSAIERVQFSHIETCIGWGGSANGVQVLNCVVDVTCGSADAQGAPYVFQGVGLIGSPSGNVIRDGIIELTYYPYGVSFTAGGASNNQLNIIDGVGFYDEASGAPTLGGVYYGTNAKYNTLRPSFWDTVLNGLQISNGGPEAASNNFFPPPAFASTQAAGWNVTGAAAVSGTLSVGNTSAGNRIDAGDGAGVEIGQINGGSSGSGAGGSWWIKHAGAYAGSFGTYSATVGGTYSAVMLAHGNAGLNLGSGAVYNAVQIAATSVVVNVLEYLTAANTITAFAGGGQASATLLTAQVVRVQTVATAADSVKLPPTTTPGLVVYLTNGAANSMQVFGSNTDTINDVATATGVAHAGGLTAIYSSPAPGLWYRNT